MHGNDDLDSLYNNHILQQLDRSSYDWNEYCQYDGDEE